MLNDLASLCLVSQSTQEGNDNSHDLPFRLSKTPQTATSAAFFFRQFTRKKTPYTP